GWAPLVVHGPGEIDDARAVVEASEGAARLAPPTDLAQLAALIERAALFVGGDSGPLHLACAVGCPVLGIYGPTDPLVNRPWGVPFRTVAAAGRVYRGIKRVDRAGGFDGLDAAQVVGALDALLDELTSSRP
ncbi:MAG TPA: glycosyltransferase family 9 protein, partial [Candidatus Polarisedimenticolaceae bacterium]|nr:glycosyltransferase family 9 protein [Candidatus Polarisedimenticolaceae bacterium]